MNKTRLYIELLLVAVIFVGALVACGLYLWGEMMRMTCADFTSQAEAQQAFNLGNTRLDRGGEVGLACENLK